MKKNILICTLIVVSFGLILTVSCKKDNKNDNSTPPGNVPVLATSLVTNVGGSSAICGGIISNDEGLTVTARGVCWSTGQTPTVSNSKTIDGTGAGNFISAIINLTPFTTYYVRAYATNSAGTGYGSAMSFTTTDIIIGDFYQGGKIAYFFQVGDPGYDAGQKHGLIAALTDQSTGIQWYNGSYTTTGANGSGLGTGKTNTSAIVSSQGAGNYAAKICDDLVTGGYSDWYLPSISELIIICQSQNVIGGFDVTKSYWSSTEQNANDAWWDYIAYSSYNYSSKQALSNVRAIRYF